MKGLNRISILGNIGAPPEVKTSAAGNRFARFTLATSEKWADGERTDWHRCVAFGKLVDVVEKILQKGTLALIEGRMEYEEYEKDGVRQRNATVHVQNLIVLSPKSSSDERPSLHRAKRQEDDLPF
jgi:single-strand DNA-binding protein